jgi:hypothetical protein
MVPAALVVAAEMEMTGVAPPLDTMGAVPETPVTVPAAGAAQFVPPLPSVVRTYPLVPRVAGSARLVPVPLPLIVNEPPMVVFAFFSITKALLRSFEYSPLPIVNSLSFELNISELFGVYWVAISPKTVSPYEGAVFKYPDATE